MLMLLFHVGQDCYACSCEHILEIIPHIELKPLPHMPPYVVGTVIYSGKPLPVIDWSKIIHDAPSQSSFHTRIIMFHMVREEKVFEFGLMAELVTKTAHLSKSDFVESGVTKEETPYFGGVYTDEKKTIQFVEVEKLIDFLQNVVSGVE